MNIPAALSPPRWPVEYTNAEILHLWRIANQTPWAANPPIDTNGSPSAGLPPHLSKSSSSSFCAYRHPLARPRRGESSSMRLRGLYLEAQRYLMEHHKRIGNYSAALRITQRMVVVEPLHQLAHLDLMRLYHPHAFINCIWWEPGLTRPDGLLFWRGQVQHPISGRSRIFQSLNDLLHFIHDPTGNLRSMENETKGEKP